MGLSGLDFQLVDVQFTKGLDTKTNPKLVLPGKWRQLVNVSLTADGTPRKRDGWARMENTAGNGLATYNQQLLSYRGGVVKSWSPNANGGSGALLPVNGTLGYMQIFSRQDIRRTAPMTAAGAVNVDSPDCASGGGFDCYVFRDTSTAAVVSISYALVDQTSGVQVSAGTLVTSATVSNPRVVYSGGAFWMFWLTVAQIHCRIIETAAPTVLGADTTILNNANLSNLRFDACEFNPSASGQVALIYPWNDAVPAFGPAAAVNSSVLVSPVTRVGNVPNAIGTQAAILTTAQGANANVTAMTCVAFSSTQLTGFVMVAGTGTGGTTVSDLFVNVNPWSVFDAAAVTAGFNHICALVIGGAYRVFYDQSAAYNTNAVLPLKDTSVTSVLALTAATTLTNSATFTGGAAVCAGPQGPFIWGKPFTDGTGVYLPVVIQENYTGLGANTVSFNTQNSIYIYECGNTVNLSADGRPGAIVARALYGNFAAPQPAGAAPVNSGCCSVAPFGTAFTVPALINGPLQLFNGVNQTPVGLCALRMATKRNGPLVRQQLGSATHFACGSPSAFDGVNMAEEGFPLFPEGISVVANNTGINLSTAGAHQWVAVYEWVDSAGARHQSAPSPAVTVTQFALGTVTVQVPTLLLSQKPNIGIALYSTQAAGLIFTRVTPVDAILQNTTTTAFVTVTVSAADATFAGNEALYTQPNIAGTTLPNDAPPPSSTLAVHQNRMFADVCDDPGAYRFSQAWVPGVGLQWNETLGGRVPQEVGVAGQNPITGFAELDEKVVIFTWEKIYVVLGTGPDVAGNFSNYSAPIELPVDVGCFYPNSILRLGPLGVIFKARKGWHVLNRDLTVRYIGEAVAQWDNQGVTSAVLLEDRKEARFTTIEGFQFTYSYLYDQWSVWSVSNGFIPIYDAVVWPSLNYYCHTNITNGLKHDTPGIYADTETGVQVPIPILMQTAWLKLSSIAGYQRVRWLYLTATSTSAVAAINTSFSLAVDYDYGDNQVAPGAYTITKALSALTFVNGMPIDMRHKLRRQKCEAVSFTFVEVPSKVSDVQLVGLQGLVLQVGIKRGTNKLPATQSFG